MKASAVILASIATLAAVGCMSRPTTTDCVELDRMRMSAKLTLAKMVDEYRMVALNSRSEQSARCVRAVYCDLHLNAAGPTAVAEDYRRHIYRENARRLRRIDKARERLGCTVVRS